MKSFILFLGVIVAMPANATQNYWQSLRENYTLGTYESTTTSETCSQSVTYSATKGPTVTTSETCSQSVTYSATKGPTVTTSENLQPKR